MDMNFLYYRLDQLMKEYKRKSSDDVHSAGDAGRKSATPAPLSPIVPLLKVPPFIFRKHSPFRSPLEKIDYNRQET